jgi:hypothetical protein
LKKNQSKKWNHTFLVIWSWRVNEWCSLVTDWFEWWTGASELMKIY